MRAFVSLFLFLFVPLVFAHEGTYDILITDQGFSPKEVIINLGETVSYHNNSSNPTWPASDIHPSHGIYPAFDPIGPIEAGNSWNFLFDRVGVWQFHDHLKPEWIGTVTVVGDASESSKITIEKSESLSEEFGVWFMSHFYRLFPLNRNAALSKINMHTLANNDKDIRYWLRVIGSEKVMEELLKDSGDGSTVDCHQEAHHIGRVAYQVFGPEAFRESSFICHSGYPHGAMEGLLVDKGTENLAKTINDVCSIFPTHFGNFECLHGVGHGVMAYQSYDLPKSLDVCKQLPGSFAQESCYGGLFMENVLVAEGKGARPGHGTTWANDDPHFPCNAMPNDYAIQRECYLMQTSRMLYISDYDFSFVADECLKAPKDMIPVCFKSMGRDIAGQTLRDPQKILSLCETIPDEYFGVCIEGALNVVIEFWGEGMADQPQKLCSLLPTDLNRKKCFQQFGTRLKDIFGNNSNHIRSLCLGNNYEKICSTAAGL